MTFHEGAQSLWDTVWCGESLARLETLPAQSIDLLLTDPPYGVTACSWDSVCDLPAFWQAVLRVMKPRAAMVLMATQPFTSELILSNRTMFKYTWVWNKRKAGNVLIARYVPLKVHEDIVVFCQATPCYYPIKVPREKVYTHGPSTGFGESIPSRTRQTDQVYTDRYPTSIIDISAVANQHRLYPTQKPVALMEYLIRTYTQEGAMVLDPFSGSGTTLLAAQRLSRRFLGIDQEPAACALALKRLGEADRG